MRCRFFRHPSGSLFLRGFRQHCSWESSCSCVGGTGPGITTEPKHADLDRSMCNKGVDNVFLRWLGRPTGEGRITRCSSPSRRRGREECVDFWGEGFLEERVSKMSGCARLSRGHLGVPGAEMEQSSRKAGHGQCHAHWQRRHQPGKAVCRGAELQQLQDVESIANIANKANIASIPHSTL